MPEKKVRTHLTHEHVERAAAAGNAAFLKWVEANMLTLEYNAEHGHVEPDNKIDRWLEEQIAEWMSGGSNHITFGNEIMLARVRLMIARGIVNYNVVNIHHEGKFIPFNRFGSPTEWPFNLCNFYQHTIRDLAKFRRKSTDG